MLLQQVVFLALAASCSAATAMKQVETVARNALAAQGWSLASKVAPEEELTLQIGLTLQNTDKLIDQLTRVSNPKSKTYGKWLDRDEVNQIVQPSQQANDAVIRWLQAEGVSQVHSDGTWVTLKTNVETANRILNADFRRYKRQGVYKIRTTEYSVPQEVFDHIDIIHPTTFFGKTEAFNPVHIPQVRRSNKLESRQVPPAPLAADPSPAIPTNPPANLPAGVYEAGPQESQTPQPGPFLVDPNCKNGITPACIKQMYNIGNYTADENSGSRVGFSSFLNQSANIEDAYTYQKYYKLPTRNFTKVFVNNAMNNQDPDQAQELGGEAGLDLQNLFGTADPVPITEFLTGGSPPFIPDLEMNTPDKNTNEPYVPYYQFLLSKRNSELPQVISNSYGEPEQTVPYRYAVRTCNMIAQLGTRGITVLESSGDTGIGSYCVKNDGSNQPTFLPEFPASCPYITAIGGTEGVSPEIAWRDSSGGFSYYFSQPSYQRRAVSNYLYRKLPRALVERYRPYFNAAGRAFPDVSAHSLYPVYGVVYGGSLSGSGGTSAASPVVAGIIALLNDARFKAGLPSLGFINPWLYDSGEDFLVDITKGAARGCDGINHQSGRRVNGSAVIPGAFWNATEGWDAATGLGVFDFQKALNATLGEDLDDDEEDDD